MGTMADAFGFTPADFFRLTLPQLSAYSRYLGEKADAASGDHPAARAPRKGASSVDSLEDLVAAFGTPEAKALVFSGG